MTSWGDFSRTFRAADSDFTFLTLAVLCFQLWVHLSADVCQSAKITTAELHHKKETRCNRAQWPTLCVVIYIYYVHISLGNFAYATLYRPLQNAAHTMRAALNDSRWLGCHSGSTVQSLQTSAGSVRDSGLDNSSRCLRWRRSGKLVGRQTNMGKINWLGWWVLYSAGGEHRSAVHCSVSGFETLNRTLKLTTWSHGATLHL